MNEISIQKPKIIHIRETYMLLTINHYWFKINIIMCVYMCAVVKINVVKISGKSSDSRFVWFKMISVERVWKTSIDKHDLLMNTFQKVCMRTDRCQETMSSRNIIITEVGKLLQHSAQQNEMQCQVKLDINTISQQVKLHTWK